MTITLNISQDLEKKLKSDAKQKGFELDRYIQYLLEEKIISGDRPASPEEKEIELIFKINQQGLSLEEWERYKLLKKKRREESLNSEELEEIIQFSDRLEELNTSRLKYLIDLAELKGSTLDEVMQSLGIQVPAYE